MGYHFKGLYTAVNSWIDSLLRTSAVRFNGAQHRGSLLSPERGAVKLPQVSGDFHVSLPELPLFVLYDKMNGSQTVPKPLKTNGGERNEFIIS